jgi:hypothetical protein
MRIIRRTLSLAPLVIARHQRLPVPPGAMVCSCRQPQYLCLDKGFDYEEPRGLPRNSASRFTCAAEARKPEPSVTRCQGAALDGGAHPLLAQPLPLHPDPLGQEAGQLPRPAPLRPRHHYLASRPTGIGSKSGQAIREISRLVTAPVLLLEIRTGGLNQKRYGSAATQLISIPTFVPLAFGILIETLGHVLRTLKLRG